MRFSANQADSQPSSHTLFVASDDNPPVGFWPDPDVLATQRSHEIFAGLHERVQEQ
jgi:hypothetical protein